MLSMGFKEKYRKENVYSARTAFFFWVEVFVCFRLSLIEMAKHTRPFSDVLHKTDERVCVGDMVEIVNSKCRTGCVQYIGPDESFTKVWYGIELDTAGGPHNGRPSESARQYFKCKANHGIFVERNQIIQVLRKSPTPVRISVNDRVFVNDQVLVNKRGKVLFVGPVAKTEGFWYGIELDEKIGHHNGTIGGVEYFRCSLSKGIHMRSMALTLITSTRPMTGKKVKSDQGLLARSSEGDPRKKEVSQKDEDKSKSKDKDKSKDEDSELKQDEVDMLRTDTDRQFKRQDPNSQHKLRQILGNVLPKRQNTVEILPENDAGRMRKFTDDYACNWETDFLGCGEFGNCYKCRSKTKFFQNKHRMFAVKKISKARFRQDKVVVGMMQHELEILRTLKKKTRNKKIVGYRNIIKVCCFFFSLQD
ncbi:hypothetical protein RFI_08747 [Reticulomyxa filosa]|uniref:CAP-Gly domain-containing protein n=1 Tax=Reticulomyxa filosa TaxID=46433 RepID=X6NSX6_RETFI|nr:hypothetical protein RFI_08747 [Reticulomyxa filosa]|eukprot:ETO28392.1 hypothetical protein RFI_08747 [Reticulomyxa filosa]